MKKSAINYFLIAPALLISIAIILVPGILTIIMSFTDWNGISPNINFIGLGNFQELFADDVFWKSIFNNVKWTILFLTIPVALALLVSALLVEKKKSRSLYQVIFLIPYVLAPAVNAMLWLNIIFNPMSGVIGYLRTIGLDIGSPLTNMSGALYAVAAVDIWHYWGYLSVIYLAALRQTPTDQVEAARVDGCNAWQVFRYVYFPSMKSTFKLMYVMIIIFSFLAFDYIKLLTGGGPAHSTEVLGTYAYTFAFSALQVGKASAVGLFMSFFGMIASVIYTKLSKNEEIA
ncbi:carbohydrate ABC transporter permease [Anaerobium acetethylicum]|uniref:Raffinose/stachyose/melibiose transport system permease protein n=1 Tax=Anaerobium acetethylicum TaxID=1619234 RepID=A0A1D3TTJ5_9FIRM|nr:sugar ABC transporter permease [Anaerobium acetethylicum]SCP97246.1 raffinose/stachyose/melibiose transport system permease protein [Anaerobium acetethylicum]